MAVLYSLGVVVPPHHRRPRGAPAARRARKLLASVVALLAVGGGTAVAAPSLPASRLAATPGGPMPTTTPSGYKRVYADDFTGDSLGSGWVAYSGKPGGDSAGWWSPSHVVVKAGEMILETYKDQAHYGGPKRYAPWVEGGVTSAPALTEKYGEYLVRSRESVAGAVADAELLWPADGVWPPEIDFTEWSGRAHKTSATLHWGTAESDRVVRILSGVTMTAWHTWGVIWSPGHISYTLDGKVWATVQSSHVPRTKMVLDIQQQIWACGNGQGDACPTASTPRHMNLDVAWVVVYARKA